MFERELDFFIKNQEELVKKYNGKFLVIQGDKVLDVYKTALEAYLKSKAKYKPGTYAIQPCVPGPQAYTVNISSSITTL